MGNRIFFTGTTYECAIKILQDGFISTRPPQRVWEEYSEYYVYLIDPQMVAEEYEANEYMDRAIVLAADQASFAVWQFDHTRRVVFEVELDDEFCETDPDCGFAVRYPFNVPLSMIRGIYVEKRNNCRKLKESVALSKLIREEKDHLLADPDERRDLLEGIKGLHYVKSEFWGDVQRRYDDLVDWQGDLSLFYYKPLKEFMIEHSHHLQQNC